MSAALKAGVMWANTFNQFDPASPFGGYKESGFGREGGRQGSGRLRETELKVGLAQNPLCCQRKEDERERVARHSLGEA